MVDIKDDILVEIAKICKQKKVNFGIFSKDFLSKHKKEIGEIQKEYFQIINIFLTGIPIHKMNSSDYSEKEKDKMIRDTSLCFKGIFTKFLESIIQGYPKNIWKIQKSKKRKSKNLSKRKMCLG